MQVITGDETLQILELDLQCCRAKGYVSANNIGEH